MIIDKPILPVIAVLAVAVPVIAWQKSKNQELRDQIEQGQAGGRMYRSGGSDFSEGGRSKGRRASSSAMRGDFSVSELQSILAESDPLNRLQDILAYADGISARDIPAMLEELRKSLGRGREMDLIAHLLLSRWAQSDPDAAYACLADGTYRSKNWSPTSLLSSLASMDPERAAAWISEPGRQSMGRGRRGGRMFEVVAGAWARQDPEGAFAWSLTLDGRQQEQAAAAVVSHVVASDPEKATGMAMQMDEGAVRAEVVEELVEMWSHSAPDQALDWAVSLSGDERREAMQESVDEWAKSDPAAVASYLSQLSSSESIEPYLSSVASRWSQNEPAQAAEWVLTQAEGRGTRDAMGHVMWNWTQQDPEGAGTWLRNQPEGASRDGAVIGLAKASSSFDPAAATQWANSISDTRRREEMVRYSLGQWRKADPEAAAAWSQQNGVSSEAGK